MDLEKLNSRAMLALAEYWLQEPFMRAQFRACDLGIALRARLREVYGDLTELYAPHLVYGIRSLVLASDGGVDELEAVCRRVHRELERRMAAARSRSSLLRISRLMDVLFPRGPDFLASQSQMRALDDGCFELATSPDHPWFTRLRSVELPENKLIEAYRAWAVIEDHRSQRARQFGLHDVSGRTMGAATKVRHKWLAVARALYTAIPLMPWSDGVRVRVYQQLDGSVATIAARVMASTSDLDSEDKLVEMFFRADDFADEDTLEFDDDELDLDEDLAQGAHPAP